MTLKVKNTKNSLYDLQLAWIKDNSELAFEDYSIFVQVVGHQNYRSYNHAHQRDSDIMDKTDVWKTLQENKS